MKNPVLALGGTGALGITVVDSFLDMGLPVAATTRSLDYVPEGLREHFREFDASVDSLEELLEGYGEGDFVVNCIGIIKPYIHDDVSSERLNAIDINSRLPYALADLAEAQGFRVIQIATDCVYSGSKGAYVESDPHDALDVYGKSKSLGEVPSPRFINLRCSIIGPELRNRRSLLEWVLAHDEGSSFTGYTDHWWNGVTTGAFARLAAGIIRTQNTLSGTVHVVPSDVVTKHELSLSILREYGREGIAVFPTDTGQHIDRTLATEFPEVNAQLWADAGYSTIPTIDRMVADLARTDIRTGVN